MEKIIDYQETPPHALPKAEQREEWDHEDYWFWRYVWAFAITACVGCFAGGFLFGLSL